MPAWTRGDGLALVLAGGNALGAYQAGVYQALHEQGIEPEWIVGTSIGAVNGAVIAGNAPERRLARLATLWRPASEDGASVWGDGLPDIWRRTGAAMETMLGGRAGVFTPLGGALGCGSGATPALYDTGPLRRSLEALVDLERLNAGAVRYTVTAVDLEDGSDVVFDTRAAVVTPQHIRASGAMPPSFPAIPIAGRLMVDGGLSANLALDPVLSSTREAPPLCIAVDLLPAAAPPPETIGEAIGRAQDLMFASQTRRSIARWRDVYRTHDDYRERSVTLVRLAYADQHREVAGKAMDFSPESIRVRWAAGQRDGAALAARLASGKVEIGRPGLTVID